MKKKIILVILLIVWMTVIFIFSSMDTNESNGKSKATIQQTVEKTVEVTEKTGITDSHPTPQKVEKVTEKLNVPLRKCAHATEYCILAVLAILLITEILNGRVSFKTVIIAVFFCFLYSLTDEYHQLYVQGRTGQFTDCLIDTVGSVIGSFIFLAIYKLRRINKKKII